ncbi:MAG: hypothetical protein HZA36_01415 [Parcubacteria group bacterium]|nr:hypothetical protein [Parcubacteria group bacterium]
MKNKLVIGSMLVLSGVVLFGVNSVSARGFDIMMGRGFVVPTPDEIATRQQAMFQNEATLLGISIDEVKNAWAEGKSMQQLMKDKGITEAQVAQRKRDAELAQFKTQLQTLVTKWIITQAQADKRLVTMQAQPQSKMKSGVEKRRGGIMGRGHRGGFWF